MNKKKKCIKSVCSKRITREKEIGYHVTPKNSFYFLYAVASPFSLLLYRSVPSKTYTVEQTLDQLRSISINATKKTAIFFDQCINGGINNRPNSSVRKVALLSSKIFGLA